MSGRTGCYRDQALVELEVLIRVPSHGYVQDTSIVRPSLRTSILDGSWNVPDFTKLNGSVGFRASVTSAPAGSPDGDAGGPAPGMRLTHLHIPIRFLTRSGRKT